MQWLCSKQKTVVFGPRFFRSAFCCGTRRQTQSCRDGIGIPSYGRYDTVFHFGTGCKLKSATCAGIFHRQPGSVLLTAGNALLNEVHAFGAVIDIRVDGILLFK